MDPKLQKKIENLLKINETIDVVPPQKSVTNTPPTFPTDNVGGPGTSIFQPKENVSELINKQTEMIIAIIKQLIENQNKIIMELINAQKQTPNVINKGEFHEKIITLNYDDKGNPVSAEVKLKPFDENKLRLEDLENKEIIDIGE